MKDKYRFIKPIIFLLIVLISGKFYLENSNESLTTPKISASNTKIIPTVASPHITKSVVSPILKQQKLISNTVAEKNQIIAGLPLKAIFKCDMSIDEDLVEQVQQTLEFYSYEMPLHIEQHQINKFLTIDVISSDLPINFRKTINEKIKLILMLYKKWFGLTLKEEMTMNLVLLPNLESYSNVISTLSLDSPNSQGLFWANSNFAFAAYRSEQQIEQTIIHELVHALNYYLIGQSARWLNEGLAMYFSKIKYYLEDNIYKYSFDFDQSINVNVALPINNLVYLEDEWDSEQREHLYDSAFQLVSYLIKHKEENNILKKLLHKEARRPCTTLDNATYLHLINENLFDLSSNF